MTLEIQTLYYRSPELILGDNEYGMGVDIWAVGLIIYEIKNKKILFQGESEIN